MANREESGEGENSTEIDKSEKEAKEQEENKSIMGNNCRMRSRMEAG